MLLSFSSRFLKTGTQERCSCNKRIKKLIIFKNYYITKGYNNNLNKQKEE